ncbi:hypothetical protein MNB_SV-15-1310 [hydrothermal vent metagenome]|uniref:Outer membrane protein beta-barrel domain-containing protein n=1 Tax=hydrothermal vent metagenome TaxID=652676 RepID=A0A1W1EL34_9ZZZZ
MKRLIVIFLIILNGLSAGDDTKYPFLGIVGYNSNLVGENFNVIAIRYGQQNRDWRTTFTLESKQGDYQLFTMGIDRTILHSLVTTKLRIYAGVRLGAITQDDNVAGDTNIGYSYGGAMGLMYYINDRLDFDIGYRYLKVTDLRGIDDIKGVSIALHYFF